MVRDEITRHSGQPRSNTVGMTQGSNLRRNSGDLREGKFPTRSYGHWKSTSCGHPNSLSINFSGILPLPSIWNLLQLLLERFRPLIRGPQEHAPFGWSSPLPDTRNTPNEQDCRQPTTEPHKKNIAHANHLFFVCLCGSRLISLVFR